MSENPGSAAPEPEPVEAQPFHAAREPGARVRDADAAAPDSSSNAWAMACHLCGLADFFNVLFGLGILLPLGIWLARRDHDPFVDEHGKEAINFQINVLFWTLVFGVLSCCLIGIPLLIALPVVETVLVVLAAIEAAGGRRYRYPLVLRVLT